MISPLNLEVYTHSSRICTNAAATFCYHYFNRGRFPFTWLASFFPNFRAIFQHQDRSLYMILRRHLRKGIAWVTLACSTSMMRWDEGRPTMMRNSIASNLLLQYVVEGGAISVSNLTQVKLGTCKMESLKWNIVCWSVSCCSFFLLLRFVTLSAEVARWSRSTEKMIGSTRIKTQHYSSFIFSSLLLPVHI